MADNNDFPPSSQMDETKDNYPPFSRSRDTAATSQDVPTGINETNPTEGAQPEHTTESHNADHSDTNGLRSCGGLFCQGHSEEELRNWDSLYGGGPQAYADAYRRGASTSRPDSGSGERSETRNPNPYAPAGTFSRGPSFLTPQLFGLLMTLSNQMQTAGGSQNDQPFYLVRIGDTRSRSQFDAEQTGENTNEETEREEQDDQADDDDTKV
ncbi:hypothetical protein TREMEDRAFT_58768 [Tremella mesenterica DSM 1558]|uniref:uncharacterized protein n=1 Tax=Tremella mesenterica (strain ATCC 24925 / CBS 8224 / DSM 1558 / NBRC 9311 / NRRL Y-6157 / RJB 2259-6 / UBC 559-6) TaxID=578456 RepID=UPI0003F48C41|nr:uncharacterized protein TREMEDRAFT_58768 [Tremella mesenterica DSM 1558]EIW72597.1 hypothetical protein TREMEDRAFT_58768 [Tremella mesenterica DSM 1558]